PLHSLQLLGFPTFLKRDGEKNTHACLHISKAGPTLVLSSEIKGHRYQLRSIRWDIQEKKKKFKISTCCNLTISQLPGKKDFFSFTFTGKRTYAVETSREQHTCGFT
uniref:Uncharacterized protein n=1 Tax=Paramormyrops kingsleyae TaxID=1676925 RepID=A0A3B3QM56_9TELE